MADLTDLPLDPDTHDLLFTGGDLVMLDPGDALAQRIRIRLRSWKGEWYLDSTFGVDYRGKVLVKNADRAVVANQFRSIVESTPGVARIVTFETDYDATARKMTITRCAVEADSGALVEVL